jgi:hypothetical protein
MANAITFYGKISLKIPNFAIYGKNMANAILFTWQMLSVLMANAWQMPCFFIASKGKYKVI